MRRNPSRRAPTACTRRPKCARHSAGHVQPVRRDAQDAARPWQPQGDARRRAEHGLARARRDAMARPRRPKTSATTHCATFSRHAKPFTSWASPSPSSFAARRTSSRPSPSTRSTGERRASSTRPYSKACGPQSPSRRSCRATRASRWTERAASTPTSGCLLLLSRLRVRLRPATTASLRSTLAFARFSPAKSPTAASSSLAAAT